MNLLDELTLEEVVITAQKRRESIQDVAAAVRALAGERIETLKPESLTDYSALFGSVERINHSILQPRTLGLSVDVRL